MVLNAEEKEEAAGVSTALVVVVCGCIGDPGGVRVVVVVVVVVVMVLLLAVRVVAVPGLPTWCSDRPPRGWALDASLDDVQVLYTARQGAPLARRTAVEYRPRPRAENCS